MNEQSLKGQVAVVTGAGRGIGRAIAIAYAQAGASVTCAARTGEEIDETVDQIQKRGGVGLAVRTDVGELASVERLFDAVVSHFGGLDIVVINAGAHADRRRVEDSKPSDWEETIRVNLIGAYHCARTAIPHLKRRGGGKIIAVGSGMGHRGREGNSAYACSKAGLWMLTRVLAQELWRDQISVNELIPGPVKTRLNQRGNDGHESEWVKSPEDVVSLALFLAMQPKMGPTAQSFSLMRRDN